MDMGMWTEIDIDHYFVKNMVKYYNNIISLLEQQNKATQELIKKESEETRSVINKGFDEIQFIIFCRFFYNAGE